MENFAENYFRELTETLAELDLSLVDVLARRILGAYERGATVFTCGNGGSAALASHLACDLGKGTCIEPEQQRLRVVALTDNLPLITAWANDLGYESIFREQLRSLVQEGDVLLAVSGSGNSPNILSAIDFANSRQMEVLGITGFKGGKMASKCSSCLIVPSDNMQVIEDIHVSISHCIFSVVRATMSANLSRGRGMFAGRVG